jgi:quercetin dioxygenase-like cupin family protein
MTLDLLAEHELDPDEGEVLDAELAVEADVLLKLFALGPGGTIDTHEHPDSTNVFHVIEGTVVVVRAGEEDQVSAPGVVLNERGQAHGARNETDETAVLTAGITPFPG